MIYAKLSTNGINNQWNKYIPFFKYIKLFNIQINYLFGCGVNRRYGLTSV